MPIGNAGSSAFPELVCGANCMDPCTAWTAVNFLAREGDYFDSKETDRKAAAFSPEKFRPRTYFIARNHLIMAISLGVQKSAIWLDEALRQATDHRKDRGGTMSIKRTIIVPAILTLSTAGSIPAASPAAVLPTQAPSVVGAAPAYLYHG